jgi:serine/threonine protein kinase
MPTRRIAQDNQGHLHRLARDSQDEHHPSVALAQRLHFLLNASDMKTENVFLKGSIAKIGDFGVASQTGGSHCLARIAEYCTESLSESMGTLYYSSPEALEGRLSVLLAHTTE